MDLIHTDGFGLLEASSIGVSRYFFLFIVDATRWTEVEIISGTFDGKRRFKAFKAYAETLPVRQIQALRLDGAGEYPFK